MSFRKRPCAVNQPTRPFFLLHPVFRRGLLFSLVLLFCWALGRSGITASVRDRDGRIADFRFREGQALVKADLSHFTDVEALSLGIEVERSNGGLLSKSINRGSDLPASAVLWNAVFSALEKQAGVNKLKRDIQMANWASGIDFDKDALMDETGEFGYFSGFGARLLKVRMDDMTLEDMLMIPSNPGDRFNLSYIHPDGDYLYGWLHNYPNPTVMVKVRLFPDLQIEEMYAIPSGAMADSNPPFSPPSHF